jgi:hypothetical protein
LVDAAEAGGREVSEVVGREWNYDVIMSKTIQILNVRVSVHRKLKKRAAKKGMSLSGYLPEEFKSLANRPTEDEIYARLATRTPVAPRFRDPSPPDWRQVSRSGTALDKGLNPALTSFTLFPARNS